MKPRSFEYHRPRDREEVVALLKAYGPQARILAGGQSLVPLLNMRTVEAGHLIDINRLREADYVRADDEVLAFGPLARARAVERRADVLETAPLISEALRITGNPTVRNRATLCGNVAHANPSSQLSAALLALDGEVRVESAAGNRLLPLRSVFVGPFEHSLQADEWIAELRVRRRRPGAGFGFCNVSRQGTPIVTVAAAAELVDGIVDHLAIGISGVAGAAYRADAAEVALLGERATSPAIAAAAAHAVATAAALSDVDASAEYRRHVAEILVQRCVNLALTRAAGDTN